MAAIRDSLDRDGYERLSRALADVAVDSRTGELRVSGRPGGVFHFRDGLVVAVESPGAPGPEVLLLRSGRVSGAQWAELMREPGAGRWPEAGLVGHGYAGAIQLRIVCMMAMQDAVFAILAGRVEDCELLDEGRPLAPVPHGETPVRLLQEATRKLAALAALPRPVRPDRARLVPAPESDDVVRLLPASQQELLAQADGRRTARDIAFRIGRSVYTVTVEMSRMLQEGHLALPTGGTTVTRGVPVAGVGPRVPSPPAAAPESRSTGQLPPRVLSALESALTTSPQETPVSSTVPEKPPSPPTVAAHTRASDSTVTHAVVTGTPDAPTPAPYALPTPDAPARDALPPVPDTTPTPADAPDPAVARSLPRRRPGASGITETLGPGRNGTSWKGFFRLRSRIRPSETGV
ncbi:MarR family transcriptional regulator [Streptomyces sp. AS02]|uniref:MarR family transcriptional regulator n=1 Tax=Streptomyces sp. AS02 TaxID=2938946 RepID=UPI0020215D46|nr:MarR family transcriptional regulator [Streptomyces sp. AS02]MCL8017971.1 MarR family transcriptional regulator [Streptomyces sp. AS02]